MNNWPEPRLNPPNPDEYSPRQQEIHDAIASGPRGGVRGPLAVWLHRPELAAHAQALGRYCRYETILPSRLSELAILVVAHIWGAEYEWHIHKRHALEAGLGGDVVDAIRAGEEPPFNDEGEAAVCAFAREAQLERCVSDETYARALQVLGKDAVVDLVGILGYYSLISLTLNIFRISLPEGAREGLS